VTDGIEHNEAASEGVPIAEQPETIDRTTSATDDSERGHEESLSRQVVLLRCVLVFFAVAMTWQWVGLTTDRPRAIDVRRGDGFKETFRVDVNRATWVEWIQLERIGQGLAHRIVADRNVNGPFATIDDLSRVPGIGPKTLDRIRPWLTISHESPPEAE
jgi:competence protein ComEA